MREFPSATHRPWEFVTTQKQGSNDVWVELIGDNLGIGEMYYHGQPKCNDDPEVNAALIVHAVNTYEERERLLEEAAEACRALVAWDESEKNGPDYGSLTRTTHPQGELIWR